MNRSELRVNNWSIWCWAQLWKYLGELLQFLSALLFFAEILLSSLLLICLSEHSCWNLCEGLGECMIYLHKENHLPPSQRDQCCPQRSIYYLPHLLHLYYAFMANQKDTDSLNMLDRLWDIIMCSTCVIKYIPDTKRDSNECASCLLQSECVTVNHQKWGIAPHCCTSLFCISLFSHVEHVTSKFSISTLKTFKLYSF